jgi:hypothetical protein
VLGGLLTQKPQSILDGVLVAVLVVAELAIDLAPFVSAVAKWPPEERTNVGVTGMIVVGFVLL